MSSGTRARAYHVAVSPRVTFGAHVAALVLGVAAVVYGAVALSAPIFGVGGALLVASGALAFMGGRSVTPARWRAQALFVSGDARGEDVERALARVVGLTTAFFGAIAVAIAIYAALIS
jgi:hypothetical protein